MKIIDKYIKLGYKNLDEKDLIKLMLYLSGYKKIDEKFESLIKYYGNYENIISNSLNCRSSNLNQKFHLISKLLNDASDNYLYDKILKENDLLTNSVLVVEFFRNKLSFKKNEYLYILMLNKNNKYITHKLVSRGTVDKACVFVRNIIEQLIECNVSSLIICHNHPSGYLEPSIEDINSTNRIKKALKLLDIELLDHIIVSKNGYYSFAERGKI